RAELPVEQGVAGLEIGGVDSAAHRRTVAGNRAAAGAVIADRTALVLGGVVVGAQAGRDQEAVAEVQGVEQIQRGGVGLAVAAGAVARPVEMAAIVPVRVVEAGCR